VGRSKKSIEHTLLIVCEGENTEPSYFESIRDIVQSDNTYWTEGITIRVSPKPKIDMNEKENTKQTINHKKKRKQRKLQAPRTVIEFEIEDKYKDNPSRYIWEAQKGLEDGTYAEAWAVFDYDNRKYIQKAFDYASEKKVNIAYSNYSFEMWILMHFEKNKTAFSASECREKNKTAFSASESKEKKKVLNCNSGVEPNDCFGSKCIGGYLRNMQYLISSTKGRNSLYDQLEDKLEFAYHNAAWLRKSNDHLVKRLFKKEELINWINLGEDHLINSTLQIKFELKETQLKAVLTNVSNTTMIIQKEALCLEDEHHCKTTIGKRLIINPQLTKTIEVLINDIKNFSYVSFQYENVKVIAEFNLS